MIAMVGPYAGSRCKAQRIDRRSNLLLVHPLESNSTWEVTQAKRLVVVVFHLPCVRPTCPLFRRNLDDVEPKAVFLNWIWGHLIRVSILEAFSH